MNTPFSHTHRYSSDIQSNSFFFEDSPRFSLPQNFKGMSIEPVETVAREKGFVQEKEVVSLKSATLKLNELVVGNWFFRSTVRGDAMCKIYYRKQQIIYEVVMNGRKNKMVVYFNYVSALQCDLSRSIMLIELNRAPHMFSTVSKSNSVWEPISDFTGGEAFRNRYHTVYFDPVQVNLESHFQKLLHCKDIAPACGKNIHIDPNDVGFYNQTMLSRMGSFNGVNLRPSFGVGNSPKQPHKSFTGSAPIKINLNRTKANEGYNTHGYMEQSQMMKRPIETSNDLYAENLNSLFREKNQPVHPPPDTNMYCEDLTYWFDKDFGYDTAYNNNSQGMNVYPDNQMNVYPSDNQPMDQMNIYSDDQMNVYHDTQNDHYYQDYTTYSNYSEELGTLFSHQNYNDVNPNQMFYEEPDYNLRNLFRKTEDENPTGQYCESDPVNFTNPTMNFEGNQLTGTSWDDLSVFWNPFEETEIYNDVEMQDHEPQDLNYLFNEDDRFYTKTGQSPDIEMFHYY
eukprot:TRINITY_DN5089_c0_g1_i1.p1 TRINITY_DN5089_c0_g1~~TRINITY_DN5089_c0_g1_i1.p1  ORF type:complete len:522 (-),score=98.75 TRINITY_DN5089_c0_g1_i1:79-1605(-)